MKRAPKLTKRERKAQSGVATAGHDHTHIHCVACGRHLDSNEFSASPATARTLACQHGSKFACCVACTQLAQRLLDTHDRTGQPVQSAAIWH
ncbi:MAG TPA: hypothetical protein VHO25_19845 [Polyangiaceae bacterium]|nr:hypothetical protein [Polyangiaceae bacterium]